MKRLIEILQILLKYDPDGDLGGADHDVVYLSRADPSAVSKEDRQRLGELYCHWDDHHESWTLFT